MGFRGRFALACSAWAALLVGSATATADTATCNYTAATHTANVTVTPGTGFSTGMSIRQSDGALVVESSASASPCGMATRTNTDTIRVTGKRRRDPRIDLPAWHPRPIRSGFH
jgi:uncharacterized membrane protein